MKGHTAVLAALMLIVASVASAQAHPCDLNPGTSFTVNAGTVTVKACWAEQDQAGAAMTATSWNLITDGTKAPLVMTKSTPTANSGGLFEFTGIAVLTKGSHAMNVDVCGDDGAGGMICTPQAVPFTVKAKGSGPKAPVNGKVS